MAVSLAPHHPDRPPLRYVLALGDDVHSFGPDLRRAGRAQIGQGDAVLSDQIVPGNGGDVSVRLVGSAL